MSHFTVLVPANDKDHLAKMLQPYHEYESTGVKDEYVVFVPLNMTEAKEKFEKFHADDPENYPTLEQFIPDYYGYEQNEAGVWGRVTNPQAKWDWYSVGGRWSGLLKLKPEGREKGENGKAGIFNEVNTDPERADAIEAGLVDWEAMRQAEMDRCGAQWDRWHEFNPVFGEALEKLSEEDRKTQTNWMWENNFIFLEAGEIDDLTNLTREQYIEKFGRGDGMTYAFIKTTGEWCGRGEMGWFGISMDEKEPTVYGEEWWKFVEGLPPEQKIYVVDCHI